MHKILKSYLRRLTNLTGNNKSLVLFRLVATHFADLHAFDFASGQTSFSLIQDLIGRKSKIKICPVTDSRDESSNKLSSSLKKINRTNNFIYEESGSKDLYVGWPFVQGKLMDGTSIRCPLMFFPVELVSDDKSWFLKQREEVNITLNKSFLLAYSHYNNVKIDDELVERIFEDFDTDSTVFRTSLYQLIKESPVELNFNSENFADQLRSFQEFKKSDFELTEKDGELKLFPEAVLGIFPQAGSHLVPDYDQLIESNTVQDIDSFFLSRTATSKSEPNRFLRSVREDKTFTPFKIDASQENALKAIKEGNSVVVQGPPGTGKSQLISNLIADFVARGKRVLMVCQKRAALDVVHARLGDIGLKPFLGLVHDFKSDRKLIYEQIGRQIESLDDYKHDNNSLDAIQLERQFLQLSHRIDQLTEEFEDFKFALFDESECGITIKELYLTSKIDDEIVNLKQEYRFFTRSALEDFRPRMRNHLAYSLRFGKAEYPLLERKPFLGYGVSDLNQMKGILNEIPVYQNQMSKRMESIINTKIGLEDALKILEKKQEVFQFLEKTADPAVYHNFQQMSEYSERETAGIWLANTERVIMDCFKGVGAETTLPSSQLGKFQEALQSAIVARKNFVKWISWTLFSKQKVLVEEVTKANGLSRNKDGFKILVQKIDNRLNLEHNITKVGTKEWLTGVPIKLEKGPLQQWFHIQKQAIKVKTIFHGIRHFKEYFGVRNLTYQELSEKIYDLFECIEEIPIKRAGWLMYFTSNQITNFFNDREKLVNVGKTLKRDFDDLCDFDALIDKTPINELVVLDKLVAEGYKTVDQAQAVFENSVAIAWIDHIETKYPVLRMAGSMKFKQEEAELQDLIREKLEISNRILLLKARERTYENVNYNRLNNLVTYRDLKHQVTKKRRIWPLRKLIANYNEELFDLVPCWMASPESVSAIFPMDEVFDLVVFDEASQCFTEKGIPAMYRGRQVMVAGDDKQLRPNDLYRIRYEVEEEQDAALEVESLLELARMHLMNVQLKGHYRSKSLDLISFSNRHFYENKLRLLPEMEAVNSNKPGIDYIKVDGVWENNSNAMEATKIIELIKELSLSHPEKDIGVVTFNAKQQTLIQDKLEDPEILETMGLHPDVFVKNIENVQGDERDIIIFSIGYAPDPSGRIIMQFGSLNADGGENRLNVAVTRAREKIYVVSSIYPKQLKVEGTKNEGPKLLRAYLEYAKLVSSGDYRAESVINIGDRKKWYLKDKIQEWAIEALPGIEASEEMPFADVAFKKNSKYVGLLLTDDDLYFQASSIKDSHVYTPFTLSKKKWKFRGYFSREYWKSSEDVKSAITRFVNVNIE